MNKKQEDFEVFLATMIGFNKIYDWPEKKLKLYTAEVHQLHLDGVGDYGFSAEFVSEVLDD